METIKQLTELDYKTLIIGITVVAGSLKIVCNFFSWFVSHLGLETKKMRQKREDHAEDRGAGAKIQGQGPPGGARQRHRAARARDDRGSRPARDGP